MNPPYESSYIFLLRSGNDELEIQYNQQSSGVYLAETQISIKTEPIDGYSYFEIDNIEDMDRLISHVSELREKMKIHYENYTQSTNE